MTSPNWRRRGVLAGIAGVAVLIAGVALVLRPSQNGISYPAAWDPRVVPIANFVQSQRGLTWKHPVKVDFMPVAQFDRFMAKENAPDPKSTEQAQKTFDVMRAIGVASGNVDLAKAEQQFAQTDVVGQYVYSVGTVYVRGDALTPYVRSVLAHELTHALQAQYFNLDTIRNGHADDDSAVTALVEGDAVRVQNAYEQTLSASDQSQLAQEEQQTSGQARGQNSQDGIPPFMVDQAEFPYDFGPTFVAALVAKGGNAEVDAAFRHPPTLDGQIVDPTTYVPGAGGTGVTPPPLPGGAHRVLPDSGFGKVTLVEMLGDQIGFDAAWTAAQGWMQDQFDAYSQNGRVCADLAVLNDSQSSASSMTDAGRAWASHLPSASVAQTGTTVDFHACDPGADWKPSTQPDDPYQALAVRSLLMYQLITDGHLKPDTAGCAADQVMTAMGPQKLEAVEQVQDPNSPSIQELRSAVVDAVSSCGQS